LMGVRGGNWRATLRFSVVRTTPGKRQGVRYCHGCIRRAGFRQFSGWAGIATGLGRPRGRIDIRASRRLGARGNAVRVAVRGPIPPRLSQGDDSAGGPAFEQGGRLSCQAAFRIEFWEGWGISVSARALRPAGLASAVAVWAAVFRGTAVNGAPAGSYLPSAPGLRLGGVNGPLVPVVASSSFFQASLVPAPFSCPAGAA